MTLRPMLTWLASAQVVAATAGAAGVKLRFETALYEDGAGTPLREPEAVAFDGKGLLVVADLGNRRLCPYTVAGTVFTPGASVTLKELPAPRAVQFTASGDVLVLDAQLRKIARLSRALEFKAYVELGESEGSVVPRAFRLDRSDNLHVLDVAGRRVLVGTLDGKVERQVRFPERSGSFSDLAIDPAGGIYAIDPVAKQVYAAKAGAAVLTPLGAPLKDDLLFPTHLAADGQGTLYVSDHNGGGIVALGLDGAFRGRQGGPGWTDGLLRYPSGLAATPSLLFVADRGNHRVQVFAVGS